MTPSAWDVFVSHLTAELRAFLGAPIIFLVGWTAIAAAMWGLMRREYGERLASKDKRIKTCEERLSWLESEVADSKREGERLREEVERLTPPPLRFQLEDIHSPVQLDDFVERVRNRTEDIAAHASVFRQGFPEWRQILRMIRACRNDGEPDPFSPEEKKEALRPALDASKDLYRTARELAHYLTGRREV
jgi:hypothetical protein